MRVLVVGETGQLARSLVCTRRWSAMELIAIGRPGLDVTLPATITRTFAQAKPDVVINAGAYTAVDDAESQPSLAQAVNAQGALQIAQACARDGLPLIHISTDYVFDGSKSTPYHEDDDVGPPSVYGRSKLDGERSVAAVCPRHIILRTSWLISPFGHNFAKTMLSLADKRSEIGVVDDQIGNPTYAPHLAAGILRLASRVGTRPEGVPWGVYHATNAGQATWCDLAREIFRQSAVLGGPVASVRAIATKDYPTRARRPQNSRLSCRKLAEAFDVVLPDWRVGVEECLTQLLPNEGNELSQSARGPT